MRKQNKITGIGQLTAFIIVTLSFFAYLFSNGQYCVPQLAWIYPILFLQVFRAYKRPIATIIAFAIFTVGFTIQFVDVLKMGLGLCIVIAFLFSSLRIIPYLLYTKEKQNTKGLMATLKFPIILVTIEYCIYLINPILAGLSDAYTQYDNLTLIPIVTVFGVYGIIFVMGWFTSIIDWILTKQVELLKDKRKIIALSLILCLLVIFSNSIYLQNKTESKMVKIASITVPVKEIIEADSDVSKVFYSNDFTKENLHNTREILEGIHNKLFEESRKEAQAGAKIVFWSELNGAVLEEDEEYLLSKASELAKQEGIYFIVSLLVKTPYEKYKQNKTIAINPQGEVVSEYYKSGLSLGELCIKGDGVIKAFDTEYGKLAPFICSDMAFSDIIRQAGREKVDIIIVPASDWQEMSPIAIKTAIIRGVENGCSVVRQTNMGISFSSGYTGHIYSKQDYYSSDNLNMVTWVPVKGRDTLYPFLGNILPILCFTSIVINFIMKFKSKRT